jgi:cell division protein FtsI (penicillin-binding protein 3)
MAVAFLAVVVVFAGFTVKLVSLQGIVAADYSTKAIAARVVETTLPTVRGSILDTNGVPLATTVDAVNVVADQNQLVNPAAAALQLAGPLQRDPAVLQRRLTGEEYYQRIARNVAAPVWAQIRSMGIEGIYAEPVAEREYPAGVVAGNVLGFLGGSEVLGDETMRGLAGLEQQFEDLLAGTPGSLRYERDAQGRVIPLADQQRVAPVAGQDVRLTLDRDLQWYTEQALAAKVKEARARSGSAVLMTPDGAVLAMASAPLMDPTKAAELDGEQQWNLAAEELYEPGSVQKVLTMAALLDAGAARPGEVFEVPDSIERSLGVISDHDPHPDWRITLSGILAQSSNVGTLLAAERLPKQTLRDYLVQFGYGEQTGIGLPGESAGKLLPIEAWTDQQADSISYGQGVATSILQLASAYATIANGGVREQPYLVQSVVDADGAERPLPRAEPVRVVSERTARQVTRMMEGVVGPDGTGQSVVVPGYRIAAKTGTAERVDPDTGGYTGGYTASFAGFAPADDPQLVMVVSIQRPINGRFGGQLGGPVFADVMSFALPRLGIAPSGAPAPDVRVWAGAAP